MLISYDRAAFTENTASFDICRKYDGMNIVVAKVKAAFTIVDKKVKIASYAVEKGNLKEINDTLTRYGEKRLGIIKKSEAVNTVINNMEEIKTAIFWAKNEN